MCDKDIKILLVDDDEDDYFITKDLLSDIRTWSPRLDWAQSFDSAVEAIEREAHDVYLLDYRLGARDGVTLMHEIFARGRYAPVILLTGQDDPEVDVLAMKGGAADFLVKGQIGTASLERSIRYAVEHHRVAEQLRQSEERLRLTLASLPLGAFTSDLSGRIRHVNPAFESIVGFSADELAGRRLDDLMHESTRDEWLVVLDDLLEKKSDTAVFDRAIVRSDGREIQGIVIARLMRDPGGRPQQIVGQLEDVTERREMERQLAQSERLKSIGQLAAGVAHEINTPTQFVGDNLQFVKDAFETLREPVARWQRRAAMPADEEAGYLLSEIPKAIDQSIAGLSQVSTIVRSVGDLVHPGSDTFELVDLNRLVDAAVLLTSRQWEAVARVEADLDPDLPEVYCMPGEINQVLLNLLLNAAQAIAARGGGGDDFEGRIEIKTGYSERWVEISVADNGGGIPAAIKPRIFDPFFTTKEVGEATGQGLAISHNIVVGQHEGRILVDSREGAGTTFRILLRRAADEQLSTGSEALAGLGGADRRESGSVE